ncbi:ferrochelatase [Corynebacterium sp. sy017]|uniref:ferrochelatase n=1 Tax=unclassified Corynebacterium TaxID=2624378 RepID=UPI001184C6B5|nr:MULTISPECIES: ferrochelatase [unclassified Corynebacterium]MBP3087636.1 ferrochelatase [Corynebacterium sp. sy017]TSD92202.1 ferrochelatase [Corynebacterium sp. SY003]
MSSYEQDSPYFDCVTSQTFDWSIADVDALLVLSFGGPEGMEDVRPFLENVTRGRGIPPERLDEVGAHYYHFGGVSPINKLNRELISNIEAELVQQNLDIPVFFGNRNWHPFAHDVVSDMAAQGIRNVLVFATSAWGGYSGCRQYGEDIEKLVDTLAVHDAPKMNFVRMRQFFDHPVFIQENAQAIRCAFAQLPQQLQEEARLVFSAHSIPIVADKASGTVEDGALYSRQVKQAAALVAQELDIDNYDVVWQSASGDGKIPWLGPDIVDHTHDLAQQEVKAMVVCSIGFISDHMEVVWDLDYELQDAAAQLGMTVVRARTIGSEKRFAQLVVSLMNETLHPDIAQHCGSVASKGVSFNGAPCEKGCCNMPKRPTRPTRENS